MLQQIGSRIMSYEQTNYHCKIGIYLKRRDIKMTLAREYSCWNAKTYNIPVRYPKMCIRAEGL